MEVEIDVCHIRKNKIQNDHIQEHVGVTLIIEELVKNRLRWLNMSKEGL